MHSQLLTLGFTKVGPGRYFSAEFCVTVLVDDTGLMTVLVNGKQMTATMTDLEDAIMGGGFGDF